MKQRFKINRPVLTVGVSVKDEDGYHPQPSLSAALAYCALNEISINCIKFELREIIPVEEHDVPVMYDENNTVKGFIGISLTPVIEGVDFRFNNQYPYANYSQTTMQSDYVWTLSGDVNIDWCKLVVNSKIPYHFELLQYALSDIMNIPSARPLILKIIHEVEDNWKDYFITKKEFMNTGLFFFEITHIPQL